MEGFLFFLKCCGLFQREREREGSVWVFWLQFQWVINLVLISRAWFGEVMCTLCPPYHTQALSHTCSIDKPIYCIPCVEQRNLCTCLHTHHVKFRFKMSTWLSLNRMCLSVRFPAKNIIVQSEHHIHSSHHILTRLRYLCCPIRQKVCRGFCQQRTS